MSELLVFHRVRSLKYLGWKTHKNGAVLEVYADGKCTQIVHGRGRVYKLIAPSVPYSFALSMLEKVRSPKDPTKILKWRKHRLLLRKIPKKYKKELRKTGEIEISNMQFLECLK